MQLLWYSGGLFTVVDMIFLVVAIGSCHAVAIVFWVIVYMAARELLGNCCGILGNYKGAMNLLWSKRWLFGSYVVSIVFYVIVRELLCSY